MDINPYIKLMVDKKADCLYLSPLSTPRLRLDKQVKNIGSTLVRDDDLQEFFKSITSNTQRLNFSTDKKLTFSFTFLGYLDCTVIISDHSPASLSILITPETEQKEEPSVEKITETLPVETPPAEPTLAESFSSIENSEPLETEKITEKETSGLERIEVLGSAPITSLDLLPYLARLVELDASDLFITAGSPVKAKVHGEAIELDSFLLTPQLTKSAAYGIMNDEQIAEFESNKDLDFAISLHDNSARFRVNVFYQRRTIGLVLRLIPSIIPTIADLNLPEVLSELIMEKRGLLLMVGGTGSGKSTSLAAMINHRNINSAGHILTIEDPVEFSHPNLKSIVNQREVGVDTSSYARALKASLREAPDVILVGEIRDRETMEAALELANTGHLCISTLHANNANQAMERIINMFPNVQHKQLFMDLSINLNAVISQRLIPDSEGKRVAAIEIMINTPHIANLILKGDLNEIKEAMKTSGSKGMRAFDDALLELYKAKRITLEEALRNADSSNDLEAKINFG